MTNKPLTYKDAGVDIDAGNRLIDRIKPAVARTQRAEALGNLGGFGGLFAVPQGYREPVLVAGTDGVGTKLRLAMHYDAHDKIGVDLVAMCVNDVAVQGAEPLFFLDYYATGKLDVDIASRVVGGIAAACEATGMTLLGGETAEMPGMYEGSDYDLAGFCVGVVERSEIIDGSAIDVGDQLLAIASSGPHSNGYSLIRRILEQRPEGANDVIDGRRVIDLLLEPTRLYPTALGELRKEVDVLGLAHITGGGLLENIPRVLADNLQARVYRDRWSWPAVFEWLQNHGQVSDEEMLRTFNCGIGMVVVVRPGDMERAMDHLTVAGQVAYPIGEICEGPQRCGLDLKRCAVLISGYGSNLQTLIDAGDRLGGEIVAVVSNRDGVEGLRRAERAGIAHHYVNPKGFDNRKAFDAALAGLLDDYSPDLLVLAGYMRILSPEFVEHFADRMLNLHPSLLPRFPGLHTHERVLEAGDAEHGATVHFVTEELDGGPPVIQYRLAVQPTDTEATLSARVQQGEYIILPKATRWFLTGRLSCRGGTVMLDGERLDDPIVVEES